MAKATRAEAAKHRDEVVTAAARLFRERGSSAVSVQEVMSAAGLTHGGFYKQFASKEELTGLAVAESFDGLLSLLNQAVEETTDVSGRRAGLLDEYLTAEHRDSPGTGCAGTAFATDATRAAADSALRRSYVEGVKRFLVEFERAMDVPDGDGEAIRRRAVFDVAAMVGALTLARATAGDPLSEEFLTAVRGILIGA
ncbi:TetR/AcrR family transcriptional regulator [Actinacidiphila sp. bgisy167]|uniref:TetR/AcrR family transcriptional regulator n=1 Tax=Actinacidiphila sp. bgisy167 TaxID=3413797 RepID=UPI003D737112